MFQFTVEGFTVTASDIDEAKRVVKIIKARNSDGQSDRLLILIGEDCKYFVFRLPADQPYDVHCVEGNEVVYGGKLFSGKSSKILSSTIKAMNARESEIARLKKNRRHKYLSQRENDIEKRIADFESCIPNSAQNMYTDITTRIELNTSYKIELLDRLEAAESNPTEHNWWPILTWYRSHILEKEDKLPASQRKDNFQLRAAFATAIIRMAKTDAKSGSILNRASSEQRDTDFWIKHAKQAGIDIDSEGDSGV